jgi:nucleoid-associated protein YgaU
MPVQSNDSTREKVKDAVKLARRYAFEIIVGGLLGVSLLIVSLIFLRFQYYRNLAKQPLPHSVVSSESENLVSDLPSSTDPKTNDKLPVRYQLKEGDSLWKIAQTVYGDGNKYILIENANHFKHNAVLVVGQVILIPKLEEPTVNERLNLGAKTTNATLSSANTTKPIMKSQVKSVKKYIAAKKVAKKLVTTKKNSSTYVVQKGDSLWKISGKKYGKGQHWPVIYQANKLKIGKNPHLIYPKTKLSIPKLTFATHQNRVK